jgi:hypothetical protein
MHPTDPAAIRANAGDFLKRNIDHAARSQPVLLELAVCGHGRSLPNNTGALVAARYKWDQFEVDAGYTWSRQANPSDSFPDGFPTTALGIFVPAGFVNYINYNVNRLLNTIWLGGKYDIWSVLPRGSASIMRCRTTAAHER